jgi:signal transduction histidine kinase
MALVPMTPRSPLDTSAFRRSGRFSGGWWRKLPFVLLLAALITGICAGQSSPPAGGHDFTTFLPRRFLTNTIQFKTLLVNDYLDPCVFRLQGVVTLVDTNRNLLVLQDATGALALHAELQGNSAQVGQLVSLEGTNCFPYIASFPDYPFCPSGWDIRNIFEAPTDWGEYYLTRMRGWLHPAVTGEYTFWIASDNSSELSLSTDGNPENVRRIASIPTYGWVTPRDWSKYPSQRSETMLLKGGQVYYIEAFQEQTTAGDNLAVAWQGPGIKQSVIAESYLSPWPNSGGQVLSAATTGILREYWTNYSAGSLANLRPPRLFESALSVADLKINVLGQTSFPEAGDIALRQPLPPNDNFRWGRVEGVVKFIGINGDAGFVELSDGQAQIQARVTHLNSDFLRHLRKSKIRIEGVCEGGYDQDGNLVPSIIWSPSEKHVFVVEASETNLVAPTDVRSLKSSPTNDDLGMGGYYGTAGEVTFNDRVFGRDCLFVQGETTAFAISFKGRRLKNQLEVGQWVELGGGLRPGKYVPTLIPLNVTATGWHAMPEPMIQAMEFPIPGSRDGRWTELEGVVRSVNSNGTLSVKGRDGSIYLWVGHTSSNYLNRYVNAKLRVRGVLSLTTLDSPVLLIPSRDFIDVEESGPEDPFKIRLRLIADLLPDMAEPALVHRVKVRGEVLDQEGPTFFLQDTSGGVRVRFRDDPSLKMGDTVEAVGFPDGNGPNRALTEAVFRTIDNPLQVEPKTLDLTDTLTSQQRNTLVKVTATLLNQKTIGTIRIFELQAQQRVFTASILDGGNRLPAIARGSRVKVIGVCVDAGLELPVAGQAALEKTEAGSLNILLRGPADIMVLSGPPWWTSGRTLVLVGVLLTVLMVTLLWVYLLRRRLHRQQAARLAFSRQILQNQESERQRIAVNLHDGLGQNLLVIKNQARLAMQPATDEAALRERLNNISEITSQAIEEVRQITHGLRPYQLDRLGLTHAIRATINRASENSSILFASYLDNIDGIFDKESEIHVYRVVQESLSNILKHSAATEATVVVKSQLASVSLSVRDNGRGFEAGTKTFMSSPELGYGITGMRERVGILGGSFFIDSVINHGSSLAIEIPKPASKP